MKAIKLFIILFFAVVNTLYAQNNGNIGQSVILDKFTPSEETCTPLSQEDIERINKNISDVLYSRIAKGAAESTNKVSKPDKRWEKRIFSDNINLQVLLEEKFNIYNEMRYNQNWKNSPYASLTPAEISAKVNSLLKQSAKEMRKNPFYKTNKFASNCGQLGLIMTDFAAFLIIQEIAVAALPAATTVTEYSAISGFAWDFAPLFKTPAFLQATGKFGQIGSTAIGFGASISILDEFHSLIKDILGLPEEDKTALGAQKDLHIVLKHKFDFESEIKEIKSNDNLNPAQKQKRIDTRYKEAIIKIYALDYVNTYLTYGEKPEKYLWAILDLTSLLQNRDTVTFEGDAGKTIQIENMPRLTERTPEMTKTLKQIMGTFIHGFRIPAYGKFLESTVEKRALKNFEKAKFDYSL